MQRVKRIWKTHMQTRLKRSFGFNASLEYSTGTSLTRPCSLTVLYSALLCINIKRVRTCSFSTKKRREMNPFCISFIWKRGKKMLKTDSNIQTEHRPSFRLFEITKIIFSTNNALKRDREKERNFYWKQFFGGKNRWENW